MAWNQIVGCRHFSCHTFSDQTQLVATRLIFCSMCQFLFILSRISYKREYKQIRDSLFPCAYKIVLNTSTNRTSSFLDISLLLKMCYSCQISLLLTQIGRFGFDKLWRQHWTPYTIERRQNSSKFPIFTGGPLLGVEAKLHCYCLSYVYPWTLKLKIYLKHKHKTENCGKCNHW